MLPDAFVSHLIAGESNAQLLMYTRNKKYSGEFLLPRFRVHLPSHIAFSALLKESEILC